MSDIVLVGIISVVPTVLIVILAGIALIAYRGPIRRVADGIAWRVKSGAHVKFASLEFGETYVVPGKGQARSSKLIEVKNDQGRRRYQERGQYYLPNRDISLVHTIHPSNDPNELYDIRVYLVPHKSALLAPVQRVEYYFGEYWHNRIFVATDRSTGFLVSTSAYGPFVCTAEVHFTDGGVAMLSRYIDFEMGHVGRG